MTYCDRLRVRLRQRMDACPTCGAPRDMSGATVARESGVAKSTLGRFMRGEVVESDVIDALDAWLAGEGVK